VVVGEAVISTDATPSSRSLHDASRFHTTCCRLVWSTFGWPLASRQSRQLVEVVQLVQIGEHDSEDPCVEHRLGSAVNLFSGMA